MPLTVRAQEAPPGYYTDQKVVYHNAGGGPDIRAYFVKLLGNLKNHLEAVGRDHVQIRVASNSDGMALFQMAQSDQALADQIDALKAQGVQFLICRNTLRERKLDWHALYGVQEADLIPSGVAELARLQTMGFVYIHP